MRVGLKNSLEQKKNAPANIKDQLSNKNNSVNHLNGNNKTF